MYMIERSGSGTLSTRQRLPTMGQRTTAGFSQQPLQVFEYRQADEWIHAGERPVASAALQDGVHRRDDRFWVPLNAVVIQTVVRMPKRQRGRRELH